MITQNEHNSEINKVLTKTFGDVKLCNLSSHIFKSQSIKLITNNPNINHQIDKVTESNINTYISNAVSTFIGRTFEKRWAFLKELKEKSKPKNIDSKSKASNSAIII